MALKALVVCKGNTCRSPMFERLLNELVSPGGHTVESAGLLGEPGRPANPHAFTCMRKIGFDISDHESRLVETLDLGSFDLVFCMNEELAESLQGLGVEAPIVLNASAGGVPNPWQQSIDVYQDCANLLASEAQKVRDLHFR